MGPGYGAVGDGTPLVLVVADDTRMLALLRALLDSFECESVEAENGPRALELAASRSPQLILLDVHMPAMDGMEVLGRLKRDPATKDIPVLMLTGQQETRYIEAAFKLGAVDYILKPLTCVQFMDIIGKTRTAFGRPLRPRAGGGG